MKKNSIEIRKNQVSFSLRAIQWKKGAGQENDRHMKKAETFLMDTMVLINFAERCENRDIFGYFQKVEIGFQIVEEVENEFKEGIKPIGQSSYDKYTKNGIIKVISNDR